MTIRIAVTTGTSLMKVSFVQRISANTSRRPRVKLTRRKSAVPSTLCARLAALTLPCNARLEVTAMMVHPDRIVDDGGSDQRHADLAPHETHLAHHHRNDLYGRDRSAVPRNKEVISR